MSQEVAEKTWKVTSEGEKAAKEAYTKSKEPAQEEKKEEENKKDEL